MVKAINWFEYSDKKRRKKWFEKDFFKLMNNANFEKTMENVRKHRDIKLVTTDKRKNQSEERYQNLIIIQQNLMAIEMKK